VSEVGIITITGEPEEINVIDAFPGERWRVVPAFERRYCVSTSARVCRIINGHLRPVAPHQLKNGYLYTRLVNGPEKKMFRLHRLVMWVFVGPCPDGFVVNHKDGDKTNNCLDNLEYVTPSENYFHAVRLGLVPPQPKRRKLATTPERSLERFFKNSDGTGLPPTPSDGIATAADRDNTAPTDTLSFVGIESRDTSTDDANASGGNELAAKIGADGEAPDSKPERFFGNPRPASPTRSAVPHV
jgi:hypothetical protein